VHRVIPFRYGGSEKANTRVSVYLYCVIIASLCVFPDNGKDVKSDPRAPFSLIYHLHMYIYIYIYYYTCIIFIHAADGFMFFRHGNLVCAHAARAQNIRENCVYIFEHRVLIGLDIKIPRKSLLGSWKCGVRVSKRAALSISNIIHLISYMCGKSCISLYIYIYIYIGT